MKGFAKTIGKFKKFTASSTRVFENDHARAGEMAQCAKGLLRKHEDPGSHLQPPCKSWEWQHMSVTYVCGK